MGYLKRYQQTYSDGRCLPGSAVVPDESGSQGCSLGFHRLITLTIITGTRKIAALRAAFSSSCGGLLMGSRIIDYMGPIFSLYNVRLFSYDFFSIVFMLFHIVS